MAREDLQLSGAKRAYRNAKNVGNHREEARWANVIGDTYKNKGEYVIALQWLRIDYEVSIKFLPEKHLLPTCQSLGEVYLRLQEFKEALIYQKKHLELAKDSNDLIEQQRANTQLGRTYHEMFSKSEDDHSSVRNAKKYFGTAMKLAQILKENPPSNNSSFLKEYIDSHNNIGMLEMDLDNLGEAKRILTKGLDICDEEEVSENDDGRSRLHHNLGSVCMELRMWDKAREHIEKDIIICKKIGHCQGEAKGYINLGELHYRVQKYEEAILCYQKALDLAKSMVDEDALVDQIDQNIETVKEAIKVMEDLKKEEQNLKKLTRKMIMARGAPQERKCLLLQNTCLDRLIEKASVVIAWQKHHEFSKRKKRITSELCDKEKLGDSFVNIGESYQKLRIFHKALKWYTKSLEIYKSIGNLEGQALAKINIGNILDSDGDWSGALDAFEEGYRIAVLAKIMSVQLLALENMHYSQMIRFDNIEEARRLQLEIRTLKQSKQRELKAHDMTGDCCSESDTGGDDDLSHTRSTACSSPVMSKSNFSKAKDFTSMEEVNGEVCLVPLLRLNKDKPKIKASYNEELSNSTRPNAGSAKTLSKSTDSQQTIVGRKRVRVVLSDDEDEMHGVSCSKGKPGKGSVEDVFTSDEFKKTFDPVSPAYEFKDISAVTSKCAISLFTPAPVEESTCSFKLKSPRVASQNGKELRSSSTDGIDSAHNLDADCPVGISENLLNSHISGEDYGSHITFKIDNDLIHIEEGLCMLRDGLSIESLKVDIACLYYLRLPSEKRSSGLLPIIQHMNCAGRSLESFETVEILRNIVQKEYIEVYINGWVQKRLIKLYVDCCKELAETPNLKLLKKLYNLEVSEDEVIVSDCDLQDVSIMPLLNALHAHKTVSMLDISHNLLGNSTMEKLQQVLMSSNQKYGGFTLDLHCNGFGPTALFQICECPVLFARLEVLNISGNRLTDACGSYLKTILENCKALYSLNIERCSITSRTIEKIADSMDSGSALSQLSLGHNNLITGNSIVDLVEKLAMLKRFSELNLNGIKLSKPAIDGLCQLAHASRLSVLMLGGSCVGTDGALQLTESLMKGTQEPVKLDLSYCGLTSLYAVKLNTDVTLVSNILELNLEGNAITEEGGNALVSILQNPECSLKVLMLNKCQLGLASVVQILHSLADNNSLEWLSLADNADLGKDCNLDCDLTTKGRIESFPLNLNISDSSPKDCKPKEDEDFMKNPCNLNTDYNQLEVADSEDEQIRVGPAVSGFEDTCTSSCPMNPCLSKCQMTEALSNGISAAKHLKLLDLSGNWLSAQTVETLYSAWSSSLRTGVAKRHIKEQIFHLSVQGVKCCGFKLCCKRD